jgi:hypothetical protein
MKIFILFEWFMVNFLSHVKNYEIACLKNPRNKGLNLLLLYSSFARPFYEDFDIGKLLEP